MYVTSWALLQTETIFFQFCMSVSWDFYGQIPASFIYVCNFLGVITDRNHVLPILYVSFLGFLRTDSSKSLFCMSTHRNSYIQSPYFFKYVCLFIRIFTDGFCNFLNMSVIQIKFINIQKTSCHIVKNMV